MKFVVILIQVLISFVLTASLMPALLLAIPPAREGRLGLGLAAAVAVVTFVLVWLVWPRRRH